MVLGSKPQYNQKGELTNKINYPKFTGEMELEDILGGMNWKGLGVCQIECVEVAIIEYEGGKYIRKGVDESLCAEVNERIHNDITGGGKPKTAIELLTEQNEALKNRLDAIEGKVEAPAAPIIPETGFDKNDIDSVRAEYLRVTGKKAHPKSKIETILSKIKELN
jgi:hypothetical protein